MCRYLQAILGAPIPAGRVAGRPAVTLSVAPAGALHDEAFDVRTHGGDLVIESGGCLGLLFGVYWLLRRWGGCRFSGLGPDGEFVPRLGRIHVEELPCRRAPLLWYRGLQFSMVEPADLAVARLDWMAKNGLNFVMALVAAEDTTEGAAPVFDPKTGMPVDAGRSKVRMTEAWFTRHLLPEILKRGLKVDVNHHNLTFWLPPAKYLKDHPDWYALRDGKRGASLSQLCVCGSQPQAVQALAGNVRAFLRRHPYVKHVGVIPEDGFGMCQCPACVSADVHPQDAFRQPSDHRCAQAENPSLSRRYARLLNAVAREVHAEFPDVSVGGAAYVDLQWPSPDEPLLPGTHVWVALYWRDGARPISPDASAHNRFFHDLLLRWKRAYPGRLILYEYYMGMKAQSGLPYPMSPVICQEWPALRGMGVEGATVQCWSQNHEAYGLNLLAFARCGWEEIVDHEELVRDYLLGMYGAAAKDVEPIYRGLTDALTALARTPVEALPPEISDGVLQPDSSNVAYFMDAVGADRIHAALDRASSSAACKRERRQVAALVWYMGYCLQAAEVFRELRRADALKPGDAASAAALRRRIAEQDIPALVRRLADSPPPGWVSPEAAARWLRMAERLRE
jgi:hypothetical protein